ncbi:MAG: sugar ABC transporter permease [Halanaerobium sp. 4-GBenrich]|jgi:sn-glycerol 3-phosphate transport system permease protein|uniref:sn-glycerol 3-phosphate transport system permease protein n=1 Tax=Halanaerobium congolense TaxID=54121 RepID=A0A1G6RUP7_9FIRM|nr:ABC transporter permease subunit [Halanaerobium congolense]KXS48727.1 MAG: sugar ABC transporter permease [Halanaerobium sp. T82-1]ODS49574.1 MAG: sugar ABC transporter permease [Halanaerobium sp. 4-GBenrich]OEG63546.1 MAG: ABC transporter permease [Halanaerobium sp. MDAL1]PUU88952.1 MAG: sugar ABC transporter permease [Halanaerobium sp.]PTX15760.1 sn-glycerol 3-phosphate transport system permease protein [Halanaerobium congolense]
MKRKKSTTIFIHLFLIISVILVSFPIIYAFMVSTLNINEVYSSPPKLQFGDNMLNNYREAWQRSNMGKLLFNSAFISVVTAVGKIILSVSAAFAFVYFGDFPGKNILFILILITHMLPLPIRIVPTYQLMDNLGWLDTYYALTIPFFASATGVLLFRQFYMTVPESLLEASLIDGITPLRFLWSILIPLSKSNIVALFTIEFIWVWNQYLWPLVTTNSAQVRVVQIGLKMLIPSDAQPEWNVIMAALIIGVIPPLLVYLTLQKSLVEGFAMQQDK